jgi:hypothetical protein
MMRPSAIASAMWRASCDVSGSLYSTAVICDMNCTGSLMSMAPSLSSAVAFG